MRLKNLSCTFAVVAIFCLAGCASPPTNLVDGVPISDKNGVLVVGLHTDWEGHNNPLLASLELIFKGGSETDPSIAYRNLTFQGKDYFTVMDLPAKKYHFYRQNFGARHLDIDEKSEFEIKAGSVTYIGDITSNVSIAGFSAGTTLQVDDRFEVAKAYLNDAYPKLLATHKIEKQILPLTVKRMK